MWKNNLISQSIDGGILHFFTIFFGGRRGKVMHLFLTKIFIIHNSNHTFLTFPYLNIFSNTNKYPQNNVIYK